MKKILTAALGLLLCLSVQSFGQKIKTKHKEKRFEPVVRQNFADYAGRYEGFDAEHFIEARIDREGRLLLTSQEGERRAELQDMRVDNASLTATKVYADGRTEKFKAVFVNRILNGDSAFGLLVEGPIRVDESITLDRAFYRRR
ncbi:MAG TPA: hypothetical protein VGC89_11655 [Pyrinomonadaceae bacterium]|jgi:hypothetical protein